MTQCRFPGSRALVWMLLLPLAIPGYIIGYAYADFLAYAGPLQTGLRELFGWATPRDYWFPNVYNVWGVSGMLVCVLYPYVYLLARAAFLEQTANAFDASRALGHGPWSAFARVALPLARPAIAAGAALALMEALADFGTMQYYGVRTFTTAIYRTWFGMGDKTAAAQLATGLLVFVLALIALELYARGSQRYTQVGRGARKGPAFRLGGWRAALAFLVCAIPVVAGFVAPVLILLRLPSDRRRSVHERALLALRRELAHPRRARVGGAGRRRGAPRLRHAPVAGPAVAGARAPFDDRLRRAGHRRRGGRPRPARRLRQRGRRVLPRDVRHLDRADPVGNAGGGDVRLSRALPGHRLRLCGIRFPEDLQDDGRCGSHAGREARRRRRAGARAAAAGLACSRRR